jgi:hypothetical protein
MGEWVKVVVVVVLPYKERKGGDEWLKYITGLKELIWGRNLGVSTCVSSYQNKVYSFFHAHLQNPTFTKFSRFNASHLGLVFSPHHLHLSLSFCYFGASSY